MEMETKIPVIRHAQLLRIVHNQNLDLEEEDELKQVPESDGGSGSLMLSAFVGDRNQVLLIDLSH